MQQLQGEQYKYVIHSVSEKFCFFIFQFSFEFVYI